MNGRGRALLEMSISKKNLEDSTEIDDQSQMRNFELDEHYFHDYNARSAHALSHSEDDEPTFQSALQYHDEEMPESVQKLSTSKKLSLKVGKRLVQMKGLLNLAVLNLMIQ